MPAKTSWVISRLSAAPLVRYGPGTDSRKDDISPWLAVLLAAASILAALRQPLWIAALF